MTDPAITAELSQQEDNEEFRSRPLGETQADLGSRECLHSEKNLAYYPAEADANGKRGCSALRTDDYDRVFRNEDRYQRFAKKKGAL